MAENLVALLIIAVLVAGFWLVLLGVLWRRRRRQMPWRRAFGVASACWRAYSRMKQLAWILAVVLVLGMLVGVWGIMPPKWPQPDCPGRVLIVKGSHSEPLECVCQGGTLSTCFNPGP